MDDAKHCGSCTQCCKVMEIKALASPTGAWCPHCKIGSGCTIYADRPEECRVFACQWLLDPSMPHRLRPDQSKVVIFAYTGSPRLIAACDPANPLAWKREPIYSRLKHYARGAFGTGRQVVAAAGRRLWIIMPDQDLYLGEVDPDAQVAVEAMADGTLKAKVLPPVEGGTRSLQVPPKSA